MNTIIFEELTVQLPDWVRDLDSFRRWAHSDESPETGRICFLDGEVWVDMSREQVFSHNQGKQEYGSVVGPLSKRERHGRYFPDGVLVTNVEAILSVQPDGTFVSTQSLRSGRVRLIEGAAEGHVELEGTPDMVLEVVSASSVTKDTESLMDLYWRAGIPEYWLVDARGDRLSFEIYRHTREGYVATRRQAGWIRSRVFGKSFRLTRRKDELGNPDFTLSVR
jgi:Uma2 family endonuclease